MDEARIDPAVVARIKRAAELKGCSTTDFILAAAEGAARQTVEKRHLRSWLSRELIIGGAGILIGIVGICAGEVADKHWQARLEEVTTLWSDAEIELSDSNEKLKSSNDELAIVEGKLAILLADSETIHKHVDAILRDHVSNRNALVAELAALQQDKRELSSKVGAVKNIAKQKIDNLTEQVLDAATLASHLQYEEDAATLKLIDERATNMDDSDRPKLKAWMMTVHMAYTTDSAMDRLRTYASLLNR
jgi:Protein of unknown function (DUF1778)